MAITLTFKGAAGNVTGSRYAIETSQARVLIDCGMFQEWKLKKRNWTAFEDEDLDYDAVLLTHAHLDHCGLLPRLVKLGFRGKIHGTAPTLKIAQIIMDDSGRIQEEDARYKMKRHKRSGRVPTADKPAPAALYTHEDAKEVPQYFAPAQQRKTVDIAPGIRATWYPAGHILGACSIMVEITDGDLSRSVLFSGDIGRWNAPLIEDPTLFESADYVVMESTYGNRNHEPNENIPEQIESIIQDTVAKGGNIIIPSFAVERSQDLLYYLSGLRNAHKIPPLMVFVDSPMAIRVTEVFRQHRDWFDDEAWEQIKDGKSLMDFKGLVLTRSVEQSKGINQIRGTAIIIAGSGMCTGGRIKHHLKHHLGDENSTILFVGYQANGTLGRQILEKPDEVRIHGDMLPVRARIERINGFSGHADQEELMKWIGHLKTPPMKVFLTHGESDAAATLSQKIISDLDFRTDVAQYNETVELD